MNADTPTLVVVEIVLWDKSHEEAVIDGLRHDQRVMSVEVISG